MLCFSSLLSWQGIESIFHPVGKAVFQSFFMIGVGQTASLPVKSERVTGAEQGGLRKSRPKWLGLALSVATVFRRQNLTNHQDQPIIAIVSE
jgi:hypothetical protein